MFSLRCLSGVQPIVLQLNIQLKSVCAISSYLPTPLTAVVQPIVLQLNIQEPLLPPGVSAELARKQAETKALEEAAAELAHLDSLQDSLRAQVEALRASPAASEVSRLQAELLAMQSKCALMHQKVTGACAVKLCVRALS